jgi:dTDP-4-dehydrorhamnose 3,5-epimerase
MKPRAPMTDSRFAISDTPLAGLKLVTRLRREDDRGFLSRLYCNEELGSAGFTRPIAQINQTMTRARGAIRGMHFQRPPHAEDKYVTCLRGEILDVAVDARAGSPTYLRWHAERLSAENGLSLFIPKGFAHGYQTLTTDCELLYLHTASHSPDAEGGINPFDPHLAIEWPLAVTDISPRDRSLALARDFTGIAI